MIATPRTKEDLKSGLPDTSQTLKLKGLNAPIEVYRDGYGIPHIQARSTHDAFFGQGFVTAQDRLWHMDCDRRRAYGRWAEYAGQVAAAQDTIMRRFQLGATVKADYDALNAETRAMLDAYAAGVNAFIENTQSLPVEYGIVDGQPDAWQPWDCLAVYKVRHILMGVFEAKLWRARLLNELGPERTARLFPGYPPGHLLIVPPGADYTGPVGDGLEELRRGVEAVSALRETDAGSNNWVLAGSRTSSGKPLLAGDPHRALETPNVYYQNHIACPEFDVVGLSFPGCPGFPHFGHNANVAWCVTHAGADYQDLFIERFDKNDPSRYEFQGQWKRAEVHQETIVVRDGEDVELNVTVTHHGPVIAGDPAQGYGLAFRYTATAEPNATAQSILEMLRATSADELDESMRYWVDPCNNFLYVDVHGNIGYLMRGQVPIRSIANAWLPVPGWTGEHEWQGFIPFEELVRSRNPDSDYIVTANNRIAGSEYPYFIALDYTPEFRARRVTARVSQVSKATVADMTSIHAERVSIPGRVYAQLLSHVEVKDDLSAKAKERLAQWDGSMERDAVAPTIYSALRYSVNRRILKHLLGPLADEALMATGRGAAAHYGRISTLLVQMAQEEDTTMLPPGSDWSALLSQALADGVGYLRDRLGDDMDSWQWGKVHFTRPHHTLSASFPELTPLLDPPSFPMGGDGDTPQAASFSPSDTFAMTGMSVARYVFDAADWNNSAWVIPLGASGHPGSPHYADQAPIWAEVKLIPMLYSWERISAQAESHQTLNPI